MIYNDCAVVLGRRALGEYDRGVALFTLAHGRVWARFGGVNRSAGKLKALSEPMVWGEYRLHVNARTQGIRVLGGRIIGTFPRLRGSLERTVEALSCCEMLARLTAEREPSQAKYQLLTTALSLLDAGPAPWLETAFGVRLLELAGYSLRELPVPPDCERLWAALHDEDLAAVASLPWQAAPGRRLREVVYDHVEAHGERALRARQVAAQIFDRGTAA